MQGLDTNVLVRFVVEDDPEQCAAARDVVAGLSPRDPGFIGLIATVEFVRVLQRTYRFPRETIAETLRELLACPEFVFEGADDLEAAIFESLQSGADLPDALMARRNAAAGCSVTHTFDRRAARLAGMSWVPRPRPEGAPAGGPN